MKRSVVLTTFVAAIVVSGCGVSTQDEPEPLVTSSVVPEPVPTLTQRPDPPSASSSATEAPSSSTGPFPTTVNG